MKLLVPILTGRENEHIFVEAITSKVDQIILLQIVDKEFHSKAGSAIGEVRQLRIVVDELKKAIGAKKKKYDELTEWGNTIPKIISVALLQKVDKVVLVKQSNQFFDSILAELKKNKVAVEPISLPEIEKK